MNDLRTMAGWLVDTGRAAGPVDQLVDAYLRERPAASPPALERQPEVDLRELGVPIAVRGAERASVFLTETRGPGAGRRFVLLRTPGGEHVMVFGPAKNAH